MCVVSSEYALTPWVVWCVWFGPALYQCGHMLWQAGTGGRGNNCRLVLQTDGNLVIYSPSKRPRLDEVVGHITLSCSPTVCQKCFALRVRRVLFPCCFLGLVVWHTCECGPSAHPSCSLPLLWPSTCRQPGLVRRRQLGLVEHGDVATIPAATRAQACAAQPNTGPGSRVGGGSHHLCRDRGRQLVHQQRRTRHPGVPGPQLGGAAGRRLWPDQSGTHRHGCAWLGQ